MNRRYKKSRAQSTLEYTLLITLIIFTFLVFKDFLLRFFAGRWRSVGDSMGVGKQYDPRDFGVAGEGGGTMECFFDNIGNRWVDTRCFKRFCDCSLPPEDPTYNDRCTICRSVTCVNNYCNDT